MTRFLFLLTLWTSLDLKAQSHTYPVAPQQPISDTLHNRVFTDPFHWMENPNDTQLKVWLKVEDDFSQREQKTFKGFSKTYDGIEAYTNNSFKNIFRKGNYYFAFYIDDRFTKPVLYYSTTSEFHLRKLVSPYDLGTKAESFNIEDIAVSENNRYLTVSVSESGSDWRSIFVIDLKTEKILADRVDWVKFSDVVWRKDGFFYKRYAVPASSQKLTAPNTGATLCYHKLNTSVTHDSIIFPHEFTGIDFDFNASSDHKYLFVYHSLIKNGKLYRTISYLNSDSIQSQTEKRFIMLAGNNNNQRFEVLDSDGDSVLVYSNYKSPNFCVYKYSLHHLNQGRLLIPEHNEILTQVHSIQHKLFCIYYKNARYVYVIYGTDGSLETHNMLPEGTAIKQISYATDDAEIIFYKTSFLYPAVVYKLNINNLTLSLLDKTYTSFDAKDFESHATTYKASDGIEIPLYITHKKGLVLDGNNPTILYGYGGFGINADPYFDPMNLYFMEKGGVFAVAGIRGGGEYGTVWHEAGKLHHKQRSFDDFIDAANYLCDNRYTSHSKLVLMGGSNGGLLVGAVITQQPTICKVAIASAGVFDMTRFQQYTVGPYHLQEFGNIYDSADFMNMLSYSPIQHIEPSTRYPSTLIISGDHDDRVPPFQSYKFLASLQNLSKQGDGKHILYMVNGAGHQLSEHLDERLHQKAYILSFIFKQLYSP